MSRCRPRASPASGLRAAAAGALVAVALGGCAVYACQPVTITVVELDEQIRLDSRLRRVLVDGTGRVKDVRDEVIVHEHWVKDEAGVWHRISSEQWHGLQVGDRLEVCR